MSGLMNMTNGRKEAHRRLLATVSAAALLGFVTTSDVYAADSEKPPIWLDISGQWDQLSDKQSRWMPDFLNGPNTGPMAGSFQDAQKTPRQGYDATASLSFRPGGGDWILSASVRIGRSRQPGKALKLDRLLPSMWHVYYPSHYGVVSHKNESHLFVDFSAGKDVGIGIAGMESTISAGVRFANLRSRSDVQISSVFVFTYYGSATNEPDTRISRKFNGWGPKISWDASLPIAGSQQDGQLGIDWGVNAALLFGRQTTRQKIDGLYRQGFWSWTLFQYVHNTQTVHTTNLRRKSVSVPALGGYLAASYKFTNAKFSLGYRADWYFNALDGGVAVSQKVNRGFFGPYASFSIGVGG